MPSIGVVWQRNSPSFVRSDPRSIVYPSLLQELSGVIQSGEPFTASASLHRLYDHVLLDKETCEGASKPVFVSNGRPPRFKRTHTSKGHCLILKDDPVVTDLEQQEEDHGEVSIDGLSRRIHTPKQERW
jgi:hypothetical protein